MGTEWHPRAARSTFIALYCACIRNVTVVSDQPVKGLLWTGLNNTSFIKTGSETSNHMSSNSDLIKPSRHREHGIAGIQSHKRLRLDFSV
jgi:hypothetical protein